MTPIEQLIESQAKLTKQIAGLLARNPSKEFDYSEGSVGASNNFLPCPKVEFLDPPFAVVGSANQFVFGASIYPQFWRIRGDIFYNSYANSGTSTRWAYKFEWDYNDQFTRPRVTFEIFDRMEQLASAAANASAVAYDHFDHTYPLRYRYLRLTQGQYAMAAKTFTPRDPNNFSQGSSPLSVGVYGE